MGLILKDEDAFAPMIQSVSLPLLLLSGVLLPMSLVPGWLETASKVNPLTHVVDACRALFRGDFGDGDVLLGAGIALALGALLAIWAREPSPGRARSRRREAYRRRHAHDEPVGTPA